MLLSICIPTFNRCENLDRLLSSITVIDKNYLNNIQICISNNNSKDETENVINKYRTKLNIKSQSLKENIGAYRNLISVLNMADGKWSLPLGDDDLIGSNFNELVKLIDNIKEETIIFNGVFNKEDQSNIFINFFDNGYVSPNKIKKRILKKGLYSFGYIGNYTFPSFYFKQLKEKPKNWIQIYLLLYSLLIKNINFFSLRKKIVFFDNSGNLFWSSENRCKINLSKLNMLINLYNKNGKLKYKFFLISIYIRELFDIENFKNLIICRVVSKREDFINILKLFKKLDNFYIINNLYFLLASLILFIPKKIFINIINYKNPKFLENYFRHLNHAKEKSNEGYQRLI